MMKTIDNLTLAAGACLASIGALMFVGPLLPVVSPAKGEEALVLGWIYLIPTALILSVAFGAAALMRGVTILRLFLMLAATAGSALLFLSFMGNS